MVNSSGKIYSELFNPSVMKKVIKNDFSHFDEWIGLLSTKEKKTVSSYLDILKVGYKKLNTEYANEYLFKNEVISNWILPNYGTDHSVVMNEFRVGSSIADLVMFNGVSKVFEIKSEVDSPKRLQSQLSNYLSLFNEVYIVVPLDKLSTYIDTPNAVGLLSYDKFTNSFQLVRSAVHNDNIEPRILMELLRKDEYLRIVESFYGELPQMTSFTMYDTCYSLIMKIPSKELNRIFIELMKKRKVHNSFSSRYYKEINQICLSLNLNKLQRKKLISNLTQTIN